MIKKTMLLVTALMIAASSATYAAKAKSIRITNQGDTDYYYKVGPHVKLIQAGSAKSFSLRGLKKVKVIAGLKKSGNNVQGDKKLITTLSIARAKANPFIETNPVTGQSTDLSN